MTKKATPEMRAQIIAGILQHVLEAPAPVTFDLAFRRALGATGLCEEDAGEAVRDAVSCLIFGGTILSNGFDREAATIRYSAAMELVPGPWLLRFVWGDRPRNHEDDEGDGQ